MGRGLHQGCSQGPTVRVVMAGVSLVLPLLKNPSAVEAANQDGLTYVTSQMWYYVAMESLLLPEDMKLDLQNDLTERLVDLYKLIIDFQVRSVIRFYRSRTKNFLRGTINYDGWEQKLQDIKDGDNELVLRFEMAMSGTNLDLVSRKLQELKNLAREAEASRKALNDLLIKMQEHVDVSRDQLTVLEEIDQHITDPQNRICLQSLRTTDPRDDIEKLKGGLLQDSYRWVLDNNDFKQWREDQRSQLLWIKGDPGKGKTMLLCGIIDELQKSTPDATAVSFFFCQATDTRINNATAVLRGLIYLLVDQQPTLISHIRQRYDHAGEKLFQDVNAWEALSKIFASILEDPCLKATYVIIDALDECTTDLNRLVDLVVQKSLGYSGVKWIVSSRNWPSIEKDLDTTTKVRLCLELNEKSISAAVNTFIRFKVDRLAKRNRYNDDTRDTVQSYLSSNANDTFLWVALVCQEFANIPGWKVNEKLMTAAFPAGLDPFYRRMMDQIFNSEYAELCKGILAVVSVMYRPIALVELASFVDMPNGVSDDESLTEIIGLCGSFLTLRERTISFVHQSAKDFLLKEASNDIFPFGIKDVHYTIFSRSLQAMSRTLRRDVYSLGAPGFSIDRVKQPDPDPLAAARYPCLYWIDHLLDCDTRANASSNLKEGGLVYKFLYQSYLYWLEAISLMRSLSGGIVMIRKLENWLKVNSSTLCYNIIRKSQLIYTKTNKYPDLYALVHDAKRFVLHSRLVIEQYPLQIYCSVLIFAPEKSIIRRQFEKCIPAWIQKKPKIQADWSAALQTLEGHSDWVRSVSFSPNGKQVVSESYDETVRLWDTTTGAMLQTLEGHSGSVRSVAFLPDSDIAHNLFVFEDWVVEKDSNLLWLPPAYRATCAALWNEIIVLGHSSGGISILGFKEGSKLV